MIIAIDYDGTIGDTNQEKVKWIKAELDKDVSPWDCNRTDCVPIIGPEAYERLGNYVYERESTLRANEVPGAREALRTLAKTCVLQVVTARLPKRVPHAREWLQRNGVLSCIKALHSSSGSSKAAVCAAINADILIDDDIRHLRNTEVAGLDRILLQHGREEAPECGPGITFCRSWREVLEHIDRMKGPGQREKMPLPGEG
jgi:5'(3')-deoxyribonucleotidase